jgi:hypothetical protein
MCAIDYGGRAGVAGRAAAAVRAAVKTRCDGGYEKLTISPPG